MPHKRSQKGTQKQINRQLLNDQKNVVTKYIFQTAFRDQIIKEIICTQTPEEIEAHLKTMLQPDSPQVYYPSNVGWQDGLVLVSSLHFEITQNMMLSPSQPNWTDDSVLHGEVSQ